MGTEASRQRLSVGFHGARSGRVVLSAGLGSLATIVAGTLGYGLGSLVLRVVADGTDIGGWASLPLVLAAGLASPMLLGTVLLIVFIVRSAAWLDGTRLARDPWLGRRRSGVRPQAVRSQSVRPGSRERRLASCTGPAEASAEGAGRVWQTTDDGDALLTFLNTRAGTLVPGPLKVTNLDPVHIKFADFDGNRRLDVVMSYDFDYSGPPSGIVVGFDNGAVIPLPGDPGGELWWDVRVVDADRNGRPDVLAVHGGPTPRAVTTFINRGNRSFVVAPVANDDRVYADRVTPTVLRVRGNDWASSNAVLTIVTPPRYGRLIRGVPPNELRYQRTAAHRLPDTFGYRLSQDGRSDTATVTVRMRD